jgi:hypothetical protein
MTAVPLSCLQTLHLCTMTLSQKVDEETGSQVMVTIFSSICKIHSLLKSGQVCTSNLFLLGMHLLNTLRCLARLQACQKCKLKAIYSSGTA